MVPKKIFISGYAKLPRGITATEMYNIVTVGLLINKQTGEILDAEASLVTTVAQNFVKNHLIGENISNIDALEKVFGDCYFGSARKAIVSALKICHEKYRQIMEGNHEDIE